MDDHGQLVRVSNLTYTYPALTRRLRVLSRKDPQTRSETTRAAVRDVSFTLSRGESLGLIGSNGAGKTTLLRLIAGIYIPDAGEVHLSGTVSTMFDSGYGMDPNISPRDNVVTRGLLLGRTKPEIESAIDDIRDFVDLGDSWHAPLRTYSTGMSSRVVVGLATAFNSDVLLMDEAVGAADIAFQEKAARRFDQLLNSTSCMVMATHNRELMSRFCSRAILLNEGRVTFMGDVGEAWTRHEQETC